MADVFVSYKTEDRRRVQPLVAALEADGLSVWWDAHIGGGTGWRESIQEHLDEARCVLVIWSKRSAGPHGSFVHDEAARAQRRGVYLPVRIDRVEPPLGFGEVQALPLNAWKGDRADPRYTALLADVHAVIERRPRAAPAMAREPATLDRRVVLVGGGVLALGAAGAGSWLLLRPRKAAAVSIAVLPFANLSGDRAQAYFADGLAEELRGALSRLPGLKVIGRTSSETVRDAEATEASRRLGVAHVLTGSVRRSQALIRVSAQLIDGKDGAQRWSESYDRAGGDALAIQADIAENVAGALSVEFGRAERQALTAGGTNNATAYDLYLKARELRAADTGEAAQRRGISLLEEAIALDPQFADALAWKAFFLPATVGQFAREQAERERGYAQAVAAAERALAIVPSHAVSHAALGEVAFGRLDASTALAMYQRARSAGIADATLLLTYGRHMAEIGRQAEAEAAINEALVRDPLNPRGRGLQAFVPFYARRYREAIDAARRSVQLAPSRHQARFWTGGALVMLGQPREAIAEYARMPTDYFFRYVGEAIAAAKTGDRVGSDRALVRAVELSGEAGSYQYAEIYAQRGESDKAFAALERALELRDPGMIVIRVDPFLDPLRRDPRLVALERQLKLP